MSKLLVTIVNYSNEEEVLKYAQMLSEQSISNEISLVITNNKKNDHSEINLEKELKKLKLNNVEIYVPKENLGYLNGCLYGYRQYRKKHRKIPEWIIISNTDVDILDKSFFEKFLEKNYEKDIWCVGPSVYSLKNKFFANPHYVTRCSLSKINRLIWIHERPFFALFYSKLANIKATFTKRVKRSSQYVYSVHGCFFALRYEFMEKIKNNFYEGFMYSEEAYIAEIILLNRKKCFYDDSLEVIHNENSVTGLLTIKEKARLIANSLKYIRKEFYKNDFQ